MKSLLKINRGLILSAAVVIGVVVYLLTLHFSQQADIPGIKSVCKNYIKTAVGYQMLPSEYRKEKPDMPQDELNSYLDKMTADIRAFYPGNSSSYRYVTDQYKEDLKSQASGTGVVYDYSKSDISFKNFQFHYNTVTVTISALTNYDGPDGSGASAQRVNLSQSTSETVVLQKTSGGWKVTYANLEKPSSAAEQSGSLTKYGVTYSVGQP